MISKLGVPSVCVIDDDEAEYGPVISALNALHIGCVHFLGKTSTDVPANPFTGLRLVFQDLHLNASGGMDAISHAANIFSKVVSPKTAPVLVVIWSKYAGESAGGDGVPAGDQETEAQRFQRVLREGEPEYVGRLIFTEMAKPKPGDRPEEAQWIETLKAEITTALEGHDSIDALWTWEFLVREACSTLSAELTTLARSIVTNPDSSLADKLKLSMQAIVQVQGEGDLSDDTIPRHLASALAQLLADQLDHMDGVTELSPHVTWMKEEVPLDVKTALAPGLNQFLLTATPPNGSTPFIPGTVYEVTDDTQLKSLFGLEREDFTSPFCNGSIKDPKFAAKAKAWSTGAKAVVMEISPVCDVPRGKRQNAIFVGGLLLPTSARAGMKSSTDSLKALEDFKLRQSIAGFPAGGFLVFRSLYKATLSAEATPLWLKPLFRMRELPTAAIRNWYAGHASRVGYASFHG